MGLENELKKIGLESQEKLVDGFGNNDFDYPAFGGNFLPNSKSAKAFWGNFFNRWLRKFVLKDRLTFVENVTKIIDCRSQLNLNEVTSIAKKAAENLIRVTNSDT